MDNLSPVKALHHRTILSVAWLIFIALALTVSACSVKASSASQKQVQTITLSPCQLSSPNLSQRMQADCGKLPVYEDRQSGTGRKIDLNIAILKSISRNPAPDPLFFIPGGPGEAATESYLIISPAFERIQQKRDIILLDQRGTGGSNPLNCADTVSDETTGNSDPQMVAKTIRACLSSLKADPTFYTTSNAVNDLDEVRAALGYEKINLYGGSYGTRVALAYLRQYPNRVRTVILDGIAPPNWTLGPDASAYAQRALDLIFQRCSQDQSCNDVFSHLPEKFQALLQDLQQKPAILKLSDPVTGKEVDFTLTPSFFENTILNLTYSPETAALLPLLIQHAYEKKDYSLIAEQGISNAGLISQSISSGMRFSVICAEDVPFYSESTPMQGYLGDEVVKSFTQVCNTWPRGQIPAGFREPVKSDIPVLLISGEADPVTPPSNGELTAQTLPNNLQLVLPGYGHINIYRGCIPSLANSFIEAGTTRGLETSCISLLKPIPFFLSFLGPKP
jgi:pimeloyl-ACP methyl ester carboxylesterase